MSELERCLRRRSALKPLEEALHIGVDARAHAPREWACGHVVSPADAAGSALAARAPALHGRRRDARVPAGERLAHAHVGPAGPLSDSS